VERAQRAAGRGQVEAGRRAPAVPDQGYRSDWLPWVLPLLLRLAHIRVAQTWHEIMPWECEAFPLPCAGAVVVVRPTTSNQQPAGVAGSWQTGG